MARTITITDTTLRDGHQSLWAARMPTEMMLPVARHQERSGVRVVDVIGHTHYVTAVRFLREDPWERVRRVREIIRTPTAAASVGSEVVGRFSAAPLDVRQLMVECSVRNGIGAIRAAHGLYDLDVIGSTLEMTKAAGAQSIACLVFSVSPVHTDELYERKTKELVARGDVDWVMIKDSSGLLTPERTGSLVDAVRRGAGDKPVTLHSHATTGMAARAYMVGVDHGVDDLHCGIWPLAWGSAQPAMQSIVRNLRECGYSVDVDDTEVERASEYLVTEATRRGLPLGVPAEYDHFHYRHQVPGGMITNLEQQLRDAGLLERLDDVLHETAAVRAELGWPTMVTPYSQFVANQALLNIMTGERYRVVPDEVKMYVLGHYGEPLAPVEPDVLDKIMENGSASITGPTEREPALPGLRKRYPKASDEELLLRYMLADADVDAMLSEKRKVPPTPSTPLSPAAGALVGLLTDITSLRHVRRVRLERRDLVVDVRM